METVHVTKKDLKISYFSKGKGGQKINRTKPFVRMHHPDSGVTVQCTEFRERSRNLRGALENLRQHPKFRWWCECELIKLERGHEIEKEIDELMEPKNFIELDDEHFKMATKNKKKEVIRGVEFYE